MIRLHLNVCRACFTVLPSAIGVLASTGPIRTFTPLSSFHAPPALLCNLRSHVRCYSNLSETRTIEPQVPLCERPAAHSVPLPSLLAWRDGAMEAATTVGSTWIGEEDAPSVEDLHTELSWLLDDAVVSIACDGGEGGSGWRDAERRLLQRSPPEHLESCVVTMREGLEELGALWDQRIKQRVPLQYLTSCAFWRDVVLSVGPGVLIPRPETELIIDFVLEAVAERPHLAQGAWADLGTGSGALAIGVARALPEAPAVWAVDLAPEPVAHAKFNARRCGVDRQVHVVQGSWYEPLLSSGVGSLAGIVSNPPYIAQEELEGLQAEVGMHEPRLALSGGDGLGVDCLLPICLGAVQLLQSGGFLALETVGGEQAEYVAHLLRHLKEGGEVPAFEEVMVRRDLRGVGRFVTASRA